MWLFILVVAVHEGAGVHRLFALGLEFVDDDKVAVGAFEHEWGALGVDTGGLAEDVGDAEDVGLEDDASFAEEDVFGLREALVGDDLAEDFLGRVVFGLEKGKAFIEFSGKSGGRVILRGGFEMENRDAVGLVGTDLGEMGDEPLSAGGGEGLVNGELIERNIFEGGLVIDGASVHGFGEFHDGIAKVGVAVQDSGFDRRGSAVSRK